jgi:NADPH-dependent 2,4-dienoyl-CoA reductase/sulfur reductase-like enzyme
MFFQIKPDPALPAHKMVININIMTSITPNSGKKKIVIVGGGFAGLNVCTAAI